MHGIMLDIETLGTSHNALILSIGAAEFKDGEILHTFHTKINPDSCVAAGLSIDPDTVFWWLEQSEEARRSVLTGIRVPLESALLELTSVFDWKGKQVWANGATFDITILESAFKAFDYPTPWQYWDVMDYRTVKNIVPREIYQACKVEATVKHDALADAVAQAKTLMNITHCMENLYDQLDLKKTA